MTLTNSARTSRALFVVHGRRVKSAIPWVSDNPWLALPLLAIPAVWLLWFKGLPPSVDGPLHVFRLLLLDRHLREGALFPRWIPDLMLGHGYPVFSFYAPGAYYVAEAFVLLGLNYYWAMIVVLTLLTIAAGFGMFLLARDLFGRQHWLAALVAGTAYMYSPYLLTNIYIRGAIAEVAAQALLPWILWATWRLTKTERPIRYVGLVALTLGGMAITHNITLLFVPVLWAGFVLVSWWQNGRQPSRLAWVLIAGVGALAVSAFFWVPLVAERQYLSGAAYQASANYMADNSWNWRNFLDATFVFDYTVSIPYQLGLVQVVLAALGLIAARRRDPIWVFLIVVAVLSALGISAWALPVWFGSELLLIAQFPWRLLTLLSIPLALFTGGLVIAWRRIDVRVGLGVTVLCLIVLANLPRLDWLGFPPASDGGSGLAAVTQFEADTGAWGTSNAAEFRPRWVQNSSLLPMSDGSAGVDTVMVERASSYDLIAETSSAGAGALRFSTFYFPGWQVLLDDKWQLQTYPSTSLGLLTVDLPPGLHRVHLTWQGTPVQRWAVTVTLLALGVMVSTGLRQGRRSWQAILPAALLVFGIGAAVYRPGVGAVQLPLAPVNGLGVRLLGYQATQDGSRYFLIRPYWYVDATPSDKFRVRWQLRDADGQVVSDSLVRPYFNAASAADWPAGTLVSDAYQLSVPPGLPAGAYQLAVRLEQGTDVAPEEPVVVGDIALAAPAPTDRQPTNLASAVYGDSILLAGYDGPVTRRLSTLGKTDLAVVRAGDTLEYELYWQALKPVSENYHGFIHLVDASGQPLVQSDHIAGTMLNPPKLWDAYHLQPDRYRLTIPESAAGGLYWPSVGLYDFGNLARLSISDTLSNAAVADYRLSALKVIGRQPARPQNQADAHFGKFASLIGYDLALPPGELHANDQVTVTLYFRSQAPTDGDYTRFLHLQSPESGMAAQYDSLPRTGNNPTWAWVPGEIIADPVVLTISPDAPAGSYLLTAGLYDNKSGGVRVSALDGRGRPLPDDQVVLTELKVE
jgi:hypothetical protein